MSTLLWVSFRCILFTQFLGSWFQSPGSVLQYQILGEWFWFCAPCQTCQFHRVPQRTPAGAAGVLCGTWITILCYHAVPLPFVCICGCVFFCACSQCTPLCLWTIIVSHLSMWPRPQQVWTHSLCWEQPAVFSLVCSAGATSFPCTTALPSSLSRSWFLLCWISWVMFIMNCRWWKGSASQKDLLRGVGRLLFSCNSTCQKPGAASSEVKTVVSSVTVRGCNSLVLFLTFCCEVPLQPLPRWCRERSCRWLWL